MAEPSVTLRPATPADAAHFLAVYAATRAEELAMTNWSDEQKALFCRMQFAAQTAHYLQYYPTAEISVIERGGQPAGRLYVERREEKIAIIDIALLPEHRGSGIGTKLLTELREEARAAGKALGIHVEKFNRALELYRRLGFQVCAEQGVYLEMEWRAKESP